MKRQALSLSARLAANLLLQISLFTLFLTSVNIDLLTEIFGQLEKFRL